MKKLLLILSISIISSSVFSASDAYKCNINATYKLGADGMLFIDGKFECYTLEDQYQAVKVMHETCIPEGTYKLKLRTVGGFNSRYTKKYPTFHRGMLWLEDVPGFE